MGAVEVGTGSVEAMSADPQWHQPACGFAVAVTPRVRTRPVWKVVRPSPSDARPWLAVGVGVLSLFLLGFLYLTKHLLPWERTCLRIHPSLSWKDVVLELRKAKSQQCCDRAIPGRVVTPASRRVESPCLPACRWSVQSFSLSSQVW